MKFGESLRKERELRGITLEEISAQSKVHIRFLEAIEQDDFSELPAKAFTKGFLRSYARMIDVDEELVLSNFEYIQHASQTRRENQTREKIRSRTSGRFVLKMLFTVILLLLLVVFLYNQGYIYIRL